MKMYNVSSWKIMRIQQSYSYTIYKIKHENLFLVLIYRKIAIRSRGF